MNYALRFRLIMRFVNIDSRYGYYLNAVFDCFTANCGRAFVCCVKFEVEPEIVSVCLLSNKFVLCSEFGFLTETNKYFKSIQCLLILKYINFAVEILPFHDHE